jgi:hypothetical protein
MNGGTAPLGAPKLGTPPAPGFPNAGNGAPDLPMPGNGAPPALPPNPGSGPGALEPITGFFWSSLNFFLQKKTDTASRKTVAKDYR